MCYLYYYWKKYHITALVILYNNYNFKDDPQKKKFTISRVETGKNAHVRGERKRGPRGSFSLHIADTNIIKNYKILLLIILTIISFPHSGKKEMLCGNCNGAGFLGGFMSTFDE